MNKKYYIVSVFGCVQPEKLIGPFSDYKRMLARASKIHAKQWENDALFYLVIEDGKKPRMESFGAMEIQFGN